MTYEAHEPWPTGLCKPHFTFFELKELRLLYLTSDSADIHVSQKFTRLILSCPHLEELTLVGCFELKKVIPKQVSNLRSKHMWIA